MQTAVTTSSVLVPLVINWSSDKNVKYYFIFHFYEIQTQLTGQREFDMIINGARALTEPILLKQWVLAAGWWSGYTEYIISLKATTNSTLPPLLNAYEVYAAAPVAVVTTYTEDGKFYSLAQINY
jgi:Malectin-like domain